MSDLQRTQDKSHFTPMFRWEKKRVEATLDNNDPKALIFPISAEFWQNPRLLLPAEYAYHDWTADWLAGDQVQVSRVDSSLCRFLNNARGAEAQEIGFVSIALPFSCGRVQHCSDPKYTADKLRINFLERVDPSKVGVLVDVSVQRFQVILAYDNQYDEKLQYNGNGYSSVIARFMGIGNCLFIYADKERNPFDIVTVYCKPIGEENAEESQFVQKRVEETVCDFQTGWHCIPMTNAATTPQQAIGNCDFRSNCALNGSRCTIRLEFWSRKHAGRKLDVKFYWQFAAIQEQFFGTKRTEYSVDHL